LEPRLLEETFELAERKKTIRKMREILISKLHDDNERKELLNALDWDTPKEVDTKQRAKFWIFAGLACIVFIII
jgi:hypothetical protein